MDAFEKEAAVYDAQFSNSIIGQLQRKLVWHLLGRYLPNHAVRILETNAGTGVDALHLSELGHQIVATDGAKAMVDILKSKGINSHVWDLRLEPPEAVANTLYDVVFSNLSGWNCISDDHISRLGATLHPLCQPNATLIVVVFGKYCKWEWLYFLTKGKWKTAFRRFRKTDQALMNNEVIQLWYHSIHDIQNALQPYFHLEAKHSVNIFVPPSYITGLQRFPLLLKCFYKIDTVLSRTQFFSNWCDHTALVFRRL
jgi:hypothetical protein